MKLSKHTEALQAYHTFWEANLSADMEIFASFLVDDFSIIGSANGEVFFGKQQAVGFYTDTADQMKGKIELRNRDISVQAIDSNSVVIREQSDVYVLIGTDWTFYGHARISCVLKQTDNGWKAVHQHASLPDHRTEEGQQIAAEKIEKENLELKEAVQRRTVELQAKNRELEIETAVERVRAQSMAMQETNDIAKVNQEIFTQISKLNIDGFTGVAIYLVDEEGMVTVWDLSSPGSMGDVNSFAFKYDPQKTPTLSEFIPVWKAGQPDYFIMDYPKERLLLGVSELEPFYPAMAENFRSAINSGTLQHQWNATAVISHGVLSLDMMKPPTDEVRSITLKMAAAFNFAHQRFHDLQNAEAQARESQVQLALERVRAKTMAMHHSNELADTASILFQQIKELGFETWSCGFCIWKDAGIVESWMGADAGGLLPPLMIPYREEQTHHEIFKAAQRGSVTYDHIWAGKDLEKYYDFLATIPSVKAALDMMKAAGLSLPSKQCYYAGFFKKGYLLLITKEPNPQLKDISQRFAQAFDLTYTRFLDLQKAEAQAREAQIEAALEKVRSRSLAVHKSGEFKEVVKIVFEKLQELGMEADAASININIPGSKDLDVYIGGRHDNVADIRSFRLLYADEVISNDRVRAQESGAEFYATTYSKADKDKFFEYQFEFSEMKNVPGDIRKRIFDSEYYTLSIAFSRHSMIVVNNFLGNHLSEYEIGLLKRFAKVFEQAYTRFLDLQKAEVQAREAQVEAALERVRSRTMGMQKSEELKDVIQIVYEQFVQLKIRLEHTGFVLDYKNRSDYYIWIADQLGTPSSVSIPYFDCIYYNRFNEAKKNSRAFFAANLTLEEKNTFYHDLFKHLPGFPEASKEFILQQPALTISTVLLDNVALYIENFSGILYTDEENAILVRLAKVFEQTYTRFLDLQKAEAQTRAAQIELAVERVRAKALAMHSSTQILDLVATLKNEMLSLEIPGVAAATIYLQEADGDIRMWDLSSVMEKEEGFKVAIDVKFKLEETDPGLYIRRVWNNQENYFIEKQEAADMVITIDWLRQYYPEQADEAQQFLDALEWGYLLHPTIQLAHGKMSVDILDTAPPAEMESIMVKMGAAFDLAYKRFLDLKQSEKQIREGQIELALERVRAKTMSMQKSDDLADAAAILFQQVKILGIETYTSGFNIWDEHQGTLVSWMANPLGIINPPFIMPAHEYGQHKRFYEAWKNNTDFTEDDLAGKKIADHYKYLRSFPLLETAFAKAEQAGIKTPDRQVHNVVFFSHGYILFVTLEPKPGYRELFKRFGQVFQQTYTRFLDLQKAEAQTREAQIEAALEKVRSRSLAMHHSDEIKEVVKTVVEKITELNIEMNGGVSLVTFSPGSKDLMHWIWIPEQFANPFNAYLPYFDNQMFYDCDAAREDGVELIGKIYSGKIKDDYFNHIFQYSGFKNAPEDLKAWVIQQPYFGFSYAIQQHSGIFLNDYTGKYFSKETNDILVRFSKVFEQSYVRFLDLKKAEAQTREAQIELSLERIRAKVTAMKVSTDLLDIVVTMRTEFVALGHEAHYFWHMRWLPDIYEKAMTAGDGTRIGNVMTLPRYMHGNIPILAKWENSKEPTIVYAMDADEAVDYVHKMITLGDFEQVDPNAPTLDDIRHIGGLTFIMARTTHGEIGYSLPGNVPNPPPEGITTLVRFAAVFDLAYRRFVDLKSSEKQIREAQIELALERVRARTMAMQHSDELADASFVLDTQVRSLGIKTWGCAFNIYGEKESTEWFSSEGGMLPAYKTPREDVFLRFYEAGQSGEQLYIEEFIGEKCKAHYEYLCTVPIMGDALRTMIEAGFSFPERQIDHATFFKYGYLLFITLEPVPDTHEIFIRFAKVFEQTYTRFLDLQKAEAQTLQAGQDLLEIKAARKKAEEALSELQATQKQLIQSEKMASLGELTAGIAHEIQNPLNFVNNFSEVSSELADEMQAEIHNGDTEAATFIANDIKQNLEKINHHGKRADAIVKSMLQHSRSSGSVVKEPTDINKLTDEYLRLAYHGLRAKDNSFNSGMKTSFDESIPPLDIVPQDIGRVVLNLLTNAFYAVNERKKIEHEAYQPMVTVSTRLVNDQVEINVTDNGSGIPEKVREKIFQPFFTTKPTGQGTGLGLSLSYDIVTKAHNGQIKVESREDEGTKFIIVLPVKNR